jgi:hypothetical protein
MQLRAVAGADDDLAPAEAGGVVSIVQLQPGAGAAGAVDGLVAQRLQPAGAGGRGGARRDQLERRGAAVEAQHELVR